MRRLKEPVEILEAKRKFEEWQEYNPGKKWHDYYVEQVCAYLDAGNPHGKLIGRSLDRFKFESSGKSKFQFLLNQGVKPDDVCVDYGCGSLRVGQHLMNYLKPSNYWGLDITDRFFKEGLRLIDPLVLEEKKPHLYVISDEVLNDVRNYRLDFVLCLGVFLHVPPFELDEFLWNFMKIIQRQTRTYITLKAADTLVQFTSRNWAYPEGFIDNNVRRYGGKTNYTVLKRTFHHEIGVEIRNVRLHITRE